jgi:hypothetical protein
LSGFGILPQEFDEDVGNLPSSKIVTSAGVTERSHHIEIGACRCQTDLAFGRLVRSDASLVDLIARIEIRRCWRRCKEQAYAGGQAGPAQFDKTPHGTTSFGASIHLSSGDSHGFEFWPRWLPTPASRSRGIQSLCGACGCGEVLRQHAHRTIDLDQARLRRTPTYFWAHDYCRLVHPDHHALIFGGNCANVRGVSGANDAY